MYHEVFYFRLFLQADRKYSRASTHYVYLRLFENYISIAFIIWEKYEEL